MITLDPNLIMQFLYAVLTNVFSWVTAIVTGFYIAISLVTAIEALFNSD